MAISIDPLTHIISIPKADLVLVQTVPTEIRELNLNTFRLELKSIEDNEEGMYLLKTHLHNTEVSLGGITYARVIEIIDPYSITFENGQYAVNLVGANSNLGDKVNVNQVSVRSNNSAGMTSSPAIEYSSFNGGVTVDTLSSYSGTNYPVGTPQQPVNNITDALLIAQYRGFPTFYVGGDITLNTGTDFDEMVFVGESKTKSVITIDDNADVENCEFYDAEITGTLDGGNVLKNCLIGNINYINGYIEQCVLKTGTITLGGSAEAHFLDCWTGVVGTDIPVIDMGGSGQGLGVRNYNGAIKIINKNGPEKIKMDVNSGEVVLDSTITAGEVTIRGIGFLDDNSTGTTTVDSDNLMSKATISDTIYDEIGSEIQYASFDNCVTIDVSGGVSGTDYPIGTLKNPVNNVSDGLTIATNNGLETFCVHGDLTLVDNVDGFEFIGHSPTKNTLTIDTSASTLNCEFRECTINGTLDGNSVLEHCVIGDLDYVEGEINSSTLMGTITLAGSAATRIYDCYDGLPGPDNPVIDCGGSGRGLNLRNYNGGIELKNKTGNEAAVLNIAAGRVVLQNTVSGGNVIVRGIGHLMDSSGEEILTGAWNGATIQNDTVNVDTVADATWEQTQKLKYRIESLRNSHVAFGNTFYWNPGDGDDVNDARTFATAVKTFARVHDLVTSEHGDVITIVGGTDFIVTENIVVTKSDVHVRGQGPGTQVQAPSGIAINISGDHCSAEAIKLDGGDTGVIVTGDGFSGTDLTVVNVSGNGIEVTSVGSKLDHVYCSGCTGNGVEIKNGTVGLRLEECGIRSSVNGININAGVIGTVLSHSTNVSSNSNYGVNINPGAIGTIIYSGAIVHSNTVEDINDNGIATVIQGTDGSISDSVWNETTSDHVSDGTFGKILKKIKQLSGLIPAGL